MSTISQRLAYLNVRFELVEDAKRSTIKVIVHAPLFVGFPKEHTWCYSNTYPRHEILNEMEAYWAPRFLP